MPNCGSCEGCLYMSTEDGLKYHIMNQHKPLEVYERVGRYWIRANKNDIRGSSELFNKYWKGYT